MTRTKMNFVLFDMEIESDSYDLEMVVRCYFYEDIHDKIRRNKCNKFGRSGGDDVIKGGGGEALTGQEDREIIKTSWSSKDKVESGEHILRRPLKTPGGGEAEEVDTTTTIS